MNLPHQLQPGKPVDLTAISCDGGALFEDGKNAAVKKFKKLRKRLIEQQYRLYAEGKQSLLVVFQALDAGGKDGTIRNVLQGVNPQGVRVASFKAPSRRELSHDFLWRVHREVPARGMIGVFNRSHYEDVLVVRVDELVPEPVWRGRYDPINQFEWLLNSNGTTILKFFLHISPEEQLERFQARIDEPAKNWKFSFGDLEKRKQWDQYCTAYEEMLSRCTTPWAPWHVIPANQKWYRNLAIMQTIVATLNAMNPQYPAPEEGLEGLVLK